jgi:hypothetical protein
MVRVIIGAPIRIATLAQAMYASPPHGLHHKRPVRTIKLAGINDKQAPTSGAEAWPSKRRKRPARSAGRKGSDAYSLLVRLQISECSSSSPSSRRA